MYNPPAFKISEREDLHRTMRAGRLANLVTSTAQGLLASPVPLFLDETEGEHGVLYGHLARANPQWNTPVLGEALAIFMGPDAYITPSWYATKAETGKVVPTWNYVSVQAHGTIEFFEDASRILEVVTRLTDLYEQPRAKPWGVGDAPRDFVKAQLRGITGLRLTITRLEGKRKMSQNRPEADRAGVVAGLAESGDATDEAVARLVPR